MEPKVVTKPSFSVVGMKYRGKNEHGEIPQLWERFLPHQDEINTKVHPDIFYGIMDHYDEQTGEFDYIAGMEVAPNGPPPTHMVEVTVPAQTYAVFKCTLPTLHQTYRLATETWLPASPYRRAASPDFELYDETFIKDETMYIYLPVEPKQT
jgi:predicted transcriptional regulator YdeE